MRLCSLWMVVVLALNSMACGAAMFSSKSMKETRAEMCDHFSRGEIDVDGALRFDIWDSPHDSLAWGAASAWNDTACMRDREQLLLCLCDDNAASYDRLDVRDRHLHFTTERYPEDGDWVE